MAYRSRTSNSRYSKSKRVPRSGYNRGRNSYSTKRKRTSGKRRSSAVQTVRIVVEQPQAQNPIPFGEQQNLFEKTSTLKKAKF